MNKKIGIGVGVATALLLGLLIFNAINNMLHLRVSSYEPHNKSPEFVAIVLNFNKQISAKTVGKVSLTPVVNGSTILDGKTVYFYPKDLLKNNQTYHVTVSGYESTDEKKMDDFSFSFVVDRNTKLSSKSQYDAQLLATDSEQRNPLINQLPYDNLTYKISAIVSGDVGDETTWKDFKDNYYLLIQTFAYKSPGKEAQYKSDTLRFRQAALNWLKSKNVNPAKDVRIFYDPNDAALGITATPAPATRE